MPVPQQLIALHVPCLQHGYIDAVLVMLPV